MPKAWSNDHAELGLGDRRSFRPTIMGTSGMVSSGHYLSTLAGVEVLQQGGNAVDAGVAAAVAGCVVQSEMVSFGGMASIHVYRADLDRSFTIAGVGHWPELASLEYFRDHCDGHVPMDARNGVVPGAPDAYLTALEQFGTWSFGRAIRRAVELAENGFPMYPFRHYRERDYAHMIERFPSTRAVIWPNGRQIAVGEIMRQPDLGWTLQTLADAESTVNSGATPQARLRGIQAARAAFYQGEIAERIDRFYRSEDAFLRKSDLKGYRVAVDPPAVGTWRGYEIRTCPFWSKGPMLIEILNMLEQDDLAALGHNSPAYVHLVAEALKLAFSDRHAYYGDPLLTDVPSEGLLSKAYAQARRTAIDPKRAWPEMPPPGDPWTGRAVREPAPALAVATGGPASEIDTSHLSVIDRWGNVFGVTFSDSFIYGPLTPGTGLTTSTRGVQSWVDPDHPNRVEPGRRMVVTGSPVMAFKDGRPILALGSPGTDVQIQATLQVLLNVLAFGMELQEAIEAPRFATYSHPESFEPHTYQPGVLKVEARVPEQTLARLQGLGHTVVPWLAWQWQAGGICAVGTLPETGVLAGGAETRREAYAIGW
ncbi:MAG: gamma-glutamyltransferase [Chloroflexota bacterium]